MRKVFMTFEVVHSFLGEGSFFKMVFADESGEISAVAFNAVRDLSHTSTMAGMW